MPAGSPKTRRGLRQRDSARIPPPVVTDSEGEDDATLSQSDSDKETPSPLRQRSHRNTSHSSPDKFSDQGSASPHFTRSHISFNSSYGSRDSSQSPSSSSLYPKLPEGTPKGENRGSDKLYPVLESSRITRSNLNNSSNLQPSSDKETPHSTFLGVLIAFVAIIILCFVLGNFSGETKAEEFDDTVTPFENFLKSMSNLEQRFPGQGRRIWKTVKATAKHVLNETDPVYPSIILIGVEVGNSRLASCIADKIASGFESSLRQSPAGQKTDIEKFRHLSAAEQKMKLDEAFQMAFTVTKSSSLLVENLQLLSAEAALLLYGYCDNDNAPYRNVLILLTVNVQQGEITLDPRQPSNVEAYLSNIWQQGMNRDKVDALMSRVANNIIVISGETEEVFQRECAS